MVRGNVALVTGRRDETSVPNNQTAMKKWNDNKMTKHAILEYLSVVYKSVPVQM